MQNITAPIQHGVAIPFIPMPDIPYYTSSDTPSTKGQKFGTLAGKMQ